MGKPRVENEIFASIVELCTQPGYIHVIANLALNYNATAYGFITSTLDRQRILNNDFLIRNEINALMGCMVKSEIDWSIPKNDRFEEMVDRSKTLLREYYKRLGSDAGYDKRKQSSVANPSPEKMGAGFREQIMYSAESAHIFQFREMAAERYRKDTAWLLENHRYRPDDANLICKAIHESQAKLAKLKWKEEIGLEEVMDGFRLNIMEVSKRSGLNKEVVDAFIETFTWDSAQKNNEYAKIDDFNAVNIRPIIRGEDGGLYLFQSYHLVEAVYDSPFYWFGEKKNADYLDKASAHRGEFPERYIETRLRKIFPSRTVIPNVESVKGGDPLSEVDCIVVYGYYALFFQAKSKRLGIEARQGDLVKIRKDFHAAVQHAYDQSVTCIKALDEKSVKFVTANKSTVDLSGVKSVYPICVVADHYPALIAQTRKFIQLKEGARIKKPVVCDLFIIDAITELLPSPLHFIDYIMWREQLGFRANTITDFATFGRYLAKNTRLDERIRKIQIDQRESCFVDIALKSRREGVIGELTPPGTLTKLQNNTLGKVFHEIERDLKPSSVEVGLMILGMDEDSIDEMNKAIEYMNSEVERTGKSLIGSILTDQKGTGLTISISSSPIKKVQEETLIHMSVNKYRQKAKKWLGLILAPTTLSFQMAMDKDQAHQYCPDMEAFIKKTDKTAPIPKAHRINSGMRPKRRASGKIGRNEMCRCGSRKKFKKCCGATKK